MTYRFPISLCLGTALVLLAPLAAAEKTSAAAEARAPLSVRAEAKPVNRAAAERPSYAELVKKAAPSVVAVVASRKEAAAAAGTPSLEDLLRRGMPGLPGPGGQPRRRERAPLPSQPSPAPASTLTAAPASGVVISADGYVLTTYRAIDGAEDVKVALGEPRKEYPAKVTGRDARSDLALLKIEVTGLTPVIWADSDGAELGDVVLALGNPAGKGLTVSRGIVAALGREGDGSDDSILTDAAINLGNSGGPLLDTDGRLVGLNSARPPREEGNAGLGFVTPANLARFVAEQLVKNGRVERALLGVETQPLEAELIAVFNVKQGALLTEVRSGSPADKGGLKGGDIVTRVDATEIRDPRHLQITIARLAPGTEINVGYVRDGQKAEATVKLGTANVEKAAANTGTGDIADTEGVLDDVSIDELTAELREELRVPKRVEGVYVTRVAPGGPSSRAGIQEGDIILELERRPARTVEEAVKLSEEIKGPKVLVQLWREGRTRFIVVDESKK
jgi:serine protease Do